MALIRSCQFRRSRTGFATISAPLIGGRERGEKVSVFRFLNKNRHLFRKLAPRAGVGSERRVSVRALFNNKLDQHLQVWNFRMQPKCIQNVARLAPYF